MEPTITSQPQSLGQSPEQSPAAKAEGGPWIIDSGIQTFAADVLEASMQIPVIVDFWASWCGPCKQLTPLLEKLTNAAEGAVRLVKVNIDDNPQLAEQLRIQSVPTVFAFKDGKGVDAFQGALPESQIKAFFVKLIGDIGPTPAEAIVQQATVLLEAGDAPGALEGFGAALEAEPGNLQALLGLARCYIIIGDLALAHEALDQIPEAAAKDPATGSAIASVEATLKLAEGAAGAATDFGPLLERIEANPKDLEARMELAEAQLAADANEEAIETLLAIVKIDRKWNDDGARKKLVTLFEALGPAHELSASGRRKLSSLLFS